MKNYVPFTIRLLDYYDFKTIEDIGRKLNHLKSLSKFGADPLKLQIIDRSLAHLLANIELL